MRCCCRPRRSSKGSRPPVPCGSANRCSKRSRVVPRGSSGRREPTRSYGRSVRQRGRASQSESLEALYRALGIKHKFTPACSPHCSDVAWRGLDIIQYAALAVRLRAPLMYLGASSDPSLRAKAASRSWTVLNGTPAVNNPSDRLP